VDCLFEGNVSPIYGGGAAGLDVGCEMTFLGCTFVNNLGPTWGQHLFVHTNSIATVRRSILYGGCGAPDAAWAQSGGTLDIDCSLVEGGPGGIGGSGTIVYGSGNLDADPMFCAPEPCNAPTHPAGVYTLDSLSPASPSLNPCGLVGAYPVACGATAVTSQQLEERSWGSIKSLYHH
jgi:hypothetical protein